MPDDGENIATRPEVLEVLGLSQSDLEGNEFPRIQGWARFEGLTFDGLERLIELMPDEWLDEGHEAAPTIGECREIGEEFPGVTFIGRVEGWGTDEARIFVDGMNVPESLTKSEFIRLLEMTGWPDAGFSETRFEWD